MSLFLIIFLIYTVILFYIAFKNRVSTDFIDYSLSSKNLGVFDLTSSIVSGFRDGAGIAVWLSLALFFGFGAIWLTFGLCAGLFLVYFIGSKMRQDTKLNNVVTISDVLKIKISPILSKIASWIILATALLYAGSQLYISGKLLSIFTGVNDKLGFIICGIITGLYTTIGGYKSVIKTDKVQWFIIMLICLIPFFFEIKTNVNSIVEQVSGLPTNYMIGFFGISFFVAFTSGDLWQRLISSRSDKDFRVASIYSMIIYLILSAAIVSCAIIMKDYITDINSPNVLFDFLNLNYQNNLLFAFIGLFVFASLMSTLDTQVFLFGYTLTNDHIKDSDSKLNITRNKTIIWILIICLILLSLTISNIITFLFSAVTLGTILVGPIFYSLIVRENLLSNYSLYIIGSVLISVLVYIILFSMGKFDNIIYNLIPPTLSFLLCTFVFFIAKIQPRLKS